MNNYQIVLNKTDKYPVIIYATSCINPIGFLDDIADDLRNSGTRPGTVLFDMLLANGEEFNRFAEGHFDGHQVQYDSITVVQVTDAVTLQAVNKHYAKNRGILNHGVLTPGQKYKYARG